MRRLLALAALIGGCLGAQEATEVRIPAFGGSVGYYALSPEAEKPPGLLVVLPAGLESSAAKSAVEEWRGAVISRGWVLAAPFGRPIGPGGWADGTVRLLDAVLEDARKRLNPDPSQIYLAAAGAAVSAAFYEASRAPDRFAAVAALGGEPREAIETNRLFGANNGQTPVLWVVEPEAQPAVRTSLSKLTAAGFRVSLQKGAEAPVEAALEWLAGHRLAKYPLRVDCETGNLEFGRCYWIRLMRFDPAQRNDVLPVSRVPPGSGAYLALGGFGYKLSAPGPGVLVEWLPENYRGPLRLGDRIVAIAGRPIQDAADYSAWMDQAGEERAVAVVVERGRERVRLETRILLPKREEIFTARVQAEYFPDSREVLIISRGVGELRLDVPAAWAPSRINWNGEDAGGAAAPGCWLLEARAKARPCAGEAK